MAYNFLEHNDRVAFHENFLNKSREWQTFVDLIEARFDLSEIHSVQQFFSQYGVIEDLLLYFNNIIKCNPNHLIFKKSIFEEVYKIEEFFLGKAEISVTKQTIQSNLGKLLFLIIFITKLQNQENDTNYLIDTNLLIRRNMFQLLKVNNQKLNEINILDIFKEIKIENISLIKDIYFDNLNEKYHALNDSFLEKNRDRIIHVNSLNYNRLERPLFCDWQETYLLDMMNIGLKKGKIVSPITFKDYEVPYNKIWSNNTLDLIKKHFHSLEANFIIETIRYFLYDTVPTQQIINLHINLFIDNYKTSSSVHEKYENSSFYFISKLFQNKDKWDKKDLMRTLHTVNNVQEIKLLSQNNIPLSKDQNRILNNYYHTCYKTLDSSFDYYHFSAYITNFDNTKSITNEYLKKCPDIFNKCIYDESGILGADLFIKYMVFLTKVAGNPYIDKEYTKYEKIRIQQLWQNTYYKKCISELQPIHQEFQISKENIDKYNNNLLTDALLLSKLCITYNTSQFIKNMEFISENPITAIFNNITLNEYFPISSEYSFRRENHDIDELTINIIENIKKEYGYRFLNILETEAYIKEIHKSMVSNAYYYLGLFNKITELYTIIQTKLSNDFLLIDYDENIHLAHLTQLFPIIEILVKKLGTYYNVFPFNESEKDFMHSKDPSSVLRILIEKAYRESNDFEAIPDFLFIYHFLYNSNSLNIRNEAIHGRNFLSKDSLIFALKISLFSLYMLIYRLENIQK